MNPYNIDLTSSNLEGPIVALNVLYNGMPATSGCEKCEEINGDDARWCCRTQSPSMYYVEFLQVLKAIGDNWDEEKKTEVVLRAVRNYLDNSLSKGCVFYDNECTIYSDRPFACRMYGVISKENWDKRWETLKNRQGDQFEARPQCDLVTSEEEITPEMEAKWFLHTRKSEERIGIAPEIINRHDLGGGSYRTFHDHLLLEFFGENLLSALTQARMTDSTPEEIDLLIEELRKQLNEQAISSQVS
jgi:Fe-S-cluster containining protein